MEVLGGSGVGIMDLNDALISNGIPPRDPVAGALWIDTSTGTSVLKVYQNNAWVIQKLDVSKLDPDLATKLQGVIDTLGTIANDGVLTFSDRVTLSKELGEILGVLPSKSTGNVYPSALPDYTVLDASGSGTFANMRLRAIDVGIATDTSWYKDVETTYKALNTFLSTFTPKPWDITTANKDINVVIATPDVFRQRFLDYYMAELRLATETEKQAKKKAEEYAEKLTDGSSVVDKAVVSGNPVFTDNSDDAVVHVGIDGKSVGGGSGRNIFNLKSITSRTSLENTGDSIVITNAYGVNVGTPYFILKPNTSYTITGESVIKTVGTATIPGRLILLSKVTGIPDLMLYAGGAGKFSNTITTPSIVDYANYHGLYMYGNSTGVVEIKNIQIEEGSVATSYEPPAPTPDYPIAINSLDKSFDIVSSVGKSNLIANSNKIVTSPNNTGYGTATLMSDEPTPYYRIIATSTISTFEAPIWNWMTANAIVGKQYTLSVDVRTPTGGAVNFMGGTTTSVTDDIKQNVWTRIYLTFNYVAGKRYGGLVHAPTQLDYRNWKLEEGSFSPYSIIESEIQPNTQSPVSYKTNILLSEPLRSIGDIKDRVFLDTLDSLWKVERNVGEYTYNGSESWAIGASSGGWNVSGSTLPFYTYVLNGLKKPNTQSIATHVKTFVGSGLVSTDIEGYSTASSTYEILRVSSSRLTSGSASAFKTWLTANPVTIQYVLLTPTIETISAEQQTKLNNIQSFKGSNYVYTMANVAPSLQATFKAKAWYRNYVTERDITEVESALGGLKDFTDGAFTDGIISRAEAQAISEHLNTLAKEKLDVDANYNTVYGNVKLTGTPKTNLLSAKTAWNTAHTNLLNAITVAIADSKTTVAEKADVDSKFTAYGNAFKLLTQRLQEATIASGKTQSDESAKGAVDGIELGGTNLLPLSSLRDRASLESFTLGGLTAQLFNGQYTLLERASDTGSRATLNKKVALDFSKSVKVGDTITMSIEVYVGALPSDGSTALIRWLNTSGGMVGDSTIAINSNIVKNQWVKLSSVIVVPAGTDLSRPTAITFAISGIASLRVRNWQIEKGNKASDWSSAPEDIQEDINKKTGAPVRYIRDWLNGSTANLGNHWVALQAIALDGTDRARGILPTSDQALTNPSYLTNGSTATNPYVSGVDTGTLQYVQVDLGKVYYDIADIRVWHYYADSRAYYNTKTEISVDGTNWEPLYDSLTQGIYPETAEGNIMPTSVVDRIRIITSRVALAEQVITPEAITGTVMSQETFVEWKENVDSKANGEDVDNLMLEMGNVQDTLNGTDTTEGIITKMSTVEQKADSWTADISELKEVTGVQGTVTEQVTAYMEFKMTGLEIGKSDSDMKVNISNSQIDFMDKGVSVAYINGQKMFITQVEITESLIIGNHKIEKLDGNSDITIVSWVGQGG